jgi:hypothetical protein
MKYVDLAVNTKIQEMKRNKEDKKKRGKQKSTKANYENKK